MIEGPTTYWLALCGNATEYDAFWSWQLTINTTNPDLTTCFQNTVLVWVPCGLLWLMTPVYAVYVARKPVYHSWTSCSKLNACKLVAASVLALLALFTLLFKWIKEDSPFTLADASASLVELLTFTLVVFWTQWVFRKGLHTSALLFFFWLVLFFADVIVTRSEVMTRHSHDAIVVSQCIRMGVVSLQLILSCMGDPDACTSRVEFVLLDERTPLLLKNIPEVGSSNPCPRETSSFLSNMMFLWFTGKILLGARRKLGVSDLWDTVPANDAEHHYNNFAKEWEKEISQSDSRRTLKTFQAEPHSESPDTADNDQPSAPRPSLPRTLVRTFGLFYSRSSLFLCFNLLALLCGPWILRAVIGFLESNDPLSWKGYMLASTMLISNVVLSNGAQHHFYTAALTALRIRSALTAAVYRKALRISNTASRAVSVGAVVNLVGIDLDKVHIMLNQMNYAWATPLTVAVCMVSLWQQLGPSCLAGLALLLVFLPFNAIFVANRIKAAQIRLMTLKDKRLKLTGQILSGIKVLKLYAWEPYFERHLQEIRREEMAALKKVIMMIGGTFALWLSSPLLVALACFVTYTVSSTNHILDVEKTFVTMSLINVMTWPLTALSQVIGSSVQGLVSIRRVEDYLLNDDLETKPKSPALSNANEYGIYIDDGTFTWDRNGTTCLKSIDLKVRPGELVAIVGPVGCGKSSLLSAVLGEMQTLRGSVNIQGSVAYVPQQAWIQNLTIKDNILFSMPLDRQKYHGVLQACALQQDLDIIPGGDMAEIGEKGINLSGGQKQRLSLARAVYSDRDIYLLDDPLSAVDAHVGEHLFNKVIGPGGELKHKTRVLVTHSISHLAQMDRIVVMLDGCITETGSYEELMENDGPFAEFLRNYLKPDERDEQDGLAVSNLAPNDATVTEPLPRLRKRMSSNSSQIQMYMEETEDMEKLIQEETTQTGRVKLSVIKHLMAAAQWVYPCLLLAATLLYIATQCLTQLWLSEWSSDHPVNGTRDEELIHLRLGVYGGLAAMQVLSVVGIALSIAFGAITTSFNLHGQLLHSVFRCPMRYFDTTPVGRILNRFSRDMDIVDQQMPIFSQIFLSNATPLISMVFIVLYTMPMCATFVVPLLVLCIGLQRLYISCACQLQRLDSICRSPLYNFLSESITGAPSIRAYGFQERFTARMHTLLDRSMGAWFEVFTANRWLLALVQVSSNLVIFATAMFGIMDRDSIGANRVGMVLSFVMQMTFNMSLTLTFSTELEMQIIAVERIKEYSELENEAPWDKPEQKPPDDWPSEGGVEFQNYQTRYRPGLELVLKGINCRIEAGEKVGIVGRTGAGKSSLTLALFRLIEADNGGIVIDDRCIGDMGLHDVRGRMSIIPQDPVLFSGSLQFNLDPSGLHAENEIWNALEHAHLKPFVTSLVDGLQHTCDEDGGNLSVGQRQLVCLARALLRRSKVLVLDEATAAVDLETDDLIQSTIRSHFSSCTVITIAHRLNTVMDCDRVIVMEDGFIREFDSPSKLMANTNSKFYAMAREANVMTEFNDD